MTETTTTAPTPPEGLTDARLMDLCELSAYPDDHELLAYARAAIAADRAARLTPAPVPSFLDALRLAQGCHDYSGGYGGAEGESWHAAIDTVVTVLRRAETRPWDSQITAVFAVGADTPAPAPAPAPEEIEAQFRAWWAESYPNAPAGGHAVASHVAFALRLLGLGVQ